jgi:hypothetical protein
MTNLMNISFVIAPSPSACTPAARSLCTTCALARVECSKYFEHSTRPSQHLRQVRTDQVAALLYAMRGAARTVAVELFSPFHHIARRPYFAMSLCTW